MRIPLLIALLALATPTPASAQTDFTSRNPIGLFEDMKADTVTADLFNNFGPTPHLRFTGVAPVPGQDLIGQTSALAALDFDRDGWWDVVKADEAYPGETPSLLLMGGPAGTFTPRRDSGLPRRMGGVIAADLDNDGWTDLACIESIGGQRPANERSTLVKSSRQSWLRVLRNDAGRRFEDMTRSWLGDEPIAATGFVLADLDQDGWLDLIRAEIAGSELMDVVIHHGSAGGLADRPPTRINFAWPLENGGGAYLPVLSAFDNDDDGDLDLLLQETSFFPRRERRLAVLVNDGGVLRAPVRHPLPQIARLMPPSWVDVDNDGQFEAYGAVSDFDGGRNQLYFRTADGRFEDRGQEMGLWAGYNHCQGGSWGDWDNDGYLDFCQVRHFNRSRYTECALYWNEQGQRFLNVSDRADVALGPGSAAALSLDVDRDGDLDLILSHMSHYSDDMPLEQTGLQLLRNDSEVGHWLGVSLVGTTSNRTALGARVTVHTGAVALRQDVCNGMSWGMSQPPAQMHFGLAGAARADSIVVRWPDGRSEHWGATDADRVVVLSEGAGAARSGK